MSFHTWTTEGYGIPIGEFSMTLEGLVNALALAPKASEDMMPCVREFLKDNDLSEAKEADEENIFDPYDQEIFDDCTTDTGYILSSVTEELLGVSACVVSDFEGDEFLLYIPRYPWKMSDAEKNLTHEFLCDTFVKVIMAADKTATEEKIRELIDDQSVENGG